MIARLGLTVLLTASLTGCVGSLFSYGLQNRNEGSTPLVDFLYPDGNLPPASERRVPALSLPLKVGLVFLPERGQRQSFLTEADRLRMLQEVRSAFIDRAYIESIETIPSLYLEGQSGPLAIKQVAGVFEVDVLALMSYDQISRAADNPLSVTYLTIVGAVIFQGTDRETRTLLDLAVVDARTSTLLMRAPGVDASASKETLLTLDQAVRENQESGFEAALASLNSNLAQELDAFEERVKNREEDVDVTWRGGGGSASVWLVLAGLVFVGCRRTWSSSRTRAKTQHAQAR
ncbi:MAG: rhombotarget lipoprotein [Pseudomonadota bacterium]